MNWSVRLIITILTIVPLVKSQCSEHAEHSTMMMDHNNQDINNQDGEFYMGVGKNPFLLKEQNFTLWFHIISMTISLGILIPIGVILGFSNVKSRWYMNVQIVGITLSMIAFFFGNPSKSQDDIYPMNFHSKFGWIILIILLIQTTFGFIRFTFDEKSHKFRFVKLRLNESNESLVDSRDDSYSASSHDAAHDSLLYNSSQKEYEQGKVSSPSQNEFLSKIRSIISKKIFKIIHNILGYTLIILIYSQFLLGFITLSDTCHGESFGNCLAHYTKGSIFLWFGLVAYARYLGFFEKFGWEWNVLPINSLNDFNNQKGKVSFSFLESVIVFLYGITNTFLEHTGKGPWNHRDIQHASLAFMWWWAGLLGIILESKRIRKFLFSNSTSSIENPIPSIIFIITAISINSHHQTNEFSLAIHKQFSGFLLLAGLFRIFTIIMLHKKNNNNLIISNINYNSDDLKNFIIHPPTEFIASFCFVACGITLMLANKSIIFLFDEIYNFDTNFILNFVIAFSFLTLSFATFLLFIYKYSLPYKK